MFVRREYTFAPILESWTHMQTDKSLKSFQTVAHLLVTIAKIPWKEIDKLGAKRPEGTTLSIVFICPNPILFFAHDVNSYRW